MTIAEALKMLSDYHRKTDPTQSDEFYYTEALGFLIEETKDPGYMSELAWYYLSKRVFDQEVKYLEMASACGYGPAYEELGYVWYYGQNGETDYEKAFRYFSKGAAPDAYGNRGSLWCLYKMADMYHYGHGVSKDLVKYRSLIEEAYEAVKDPAYLNDPYPEILYRYAQILIEDGERERGADLLESAKDFMAERLSEEPFWGHIEVMGRITRRLGELRPLDRKHFDLYDLFRLSGKVGGVSFKRNGRHYRIEISEEDGAIGFEGKWYRGCEDFFEKARLGTNKLTAIYDELYDWEEVS